MASVSPARTNPRVRTEGSTATSAVTTFFFQVATRSSFTGRNGRRAGLRSVSSIFFFSILRENTRGRPPERIRSACGSSSGGISLTSHRTSAATPGAGGVPRATTAAWAPSFRVESRSMAFSIARASMPAAIPWPRR